MVNHLYCMIYIYIYYMVYLTILLDAMAILEIGKGFEVLLSFWVDIRQV